ncbi:tape measure protein [Photobacterium minamisatsumaniensis]|uniref:tape measure protein n=1 Tax=Photobacterium minamisatsumaniensis TaxID=2910233 RepID=UPI003D0F8093
MSKDLKFTLRFDAENKQFVGQVRGADNAVASLGNQSATTGRQMRTLNHQSDALEGQMLSLRNQLFGAAAGFSAIAAAQKATDRLGAYQDIRTRITALVGSQQAWIDTEQYLIEVSKEHNKAMLEMAGNYARVASVEDAGMITRQQTIAIFEGMSNAASTYGATNEQLNQSMFGLQQAMASQVVRAEELNQTTEPLPGLLTKMDKAAGLASGGFRKLVNDGKVTSDFFAETLVKALESYDGAAANTAGNINALYGDLATAYTQAVTAYEQPISDSFSPVILGLTSSLGVFADNADLVSTAVGVTMALALGRGTAAVMNMTAAQVAKVVVSRAHTAALIQDAQMTVRHTQASILATNAEIHHLEIQRKVAVGAVMATKAEERLAAARGRLAIATVTLKNAQQAAAVSGRSLGMSLSLLGGPAGIAMMAVTALGYFALSNQTAAAETDHLSDRIDHLLGRMNALQVKQVESVLAEAQAKQALVSAELETLHARKGTNDLDERLNKIEALRKKEVSWREDVLALEDKLYELRNKPEDKPKPEKKRDDKADAQAQKQLDMMQRQVALYGKKSELAKVSYDLEHGALKAINGKLKEQLLLEAKKLDNKAAEAQILQQAKALNDAGQDRLMQMQQQIALHGITSEVAKLQYEIEHGELKGINEELAKNLLLEAERLDRKQGQSPKNTRDIEAFYAESDEINGAWLMRLAMQADMENEAKIREDYAYNDRLARLSQSFQSAYAQAQENQQLQDELEREYFANREILRADHQANLTDIEKQATDERSAYQAQVAESTLTFTQQQLSITTHFLKQAGEEQGGLYRLLFAAQKLAAIPSMVVATEEAATKALSFGPPPVGMALSTAVRTMGYASVGIVAGQALAGQAHDGINRVPAKNEGTWMLRKDEMVLNPKQADNFRWMVTMMNQMKTMQSGQQQQQAMQYGGTPNVNVAAPPVHVAFLDNQEQLNAYLRSDMGEQAVVRIMKRNQTS